MPEPREANVLMAQFENEPALLCPDQRVKILTHLNEAAKNLPVIEKAAAEAQTGGDFWYPEDHHLARYRPYIVKDGILQIPVKGVLLKGFPWQDGRWATGYEYIWEAYKRGMDDSDVRGIALIIDSPGGVVSGNFELVDKMYELRDRKPVRAFAADHAYSAAYSIASVASDGIVMTRSGGVGSIGVVTSHVDWSKWNENYGIDITFIFAGKHKVDGNPEEPLKPAVKARIQKRIDALYDEFVSTVARNRGMDEQAIRDTEALTFMPDEALSNGLADEVGVLDDAVAAFAAKVSENQGDETMSNKTDTPAVDQAAVDTARAEGHAAGRTEGLAEGLAEGRTEGAKAERERIVAILGSDAAKARPKAAMATALKSDMTVEQADAFLSDLAEETAAAPAPAPQNSAGLQPGQFDQVMDKTQNPNIDSQEDNPGAANDGSDIAALARANGLSGFKPAAAN